MPETTEQNSPEAIWQALDIDDQKVCVSLMHGDWSIGEGEESLTMRGMDMNRVNSLQGRGIIEAGTQADFALVYLEEYSEEIAILEDKPFDPFYKPSDEEIAFRKKIRMSRNTIEEQYPLIRYRLVRMMYDFIKNEVLPK